MNLNFVGIGDVGVTQLADMLRESATVTVMKFRTGYKGARNKNRIGSEGARWRMGCARTRR